MPFQRAKQPSVKSMIPLKWHSKYSTDLNIFFLHSVFQGAGWSLSSSCHISFVSLCSTSVTSLSLSLTSFSSFHYVFDHFLTREFFTFFLNDFSFSSSPSLDFSSFSLAILFLFFNFGNHRVFLPAVVDLPLSLVRMKWMMDWKLRYLSNLNLA